MSDDMTNTTDTPQPLPGPVVAIPDLPVHHATGDECETDLHHTLVQIGAAAWSDPTKHYKVRCPGCGFEPGLDFLQCDRCAAAAGSHSVGCDMCGHQGTAAEFFTVYP